MLQGGVDVSLIEWSDHDGVGRRTRNGLNFTERGFGMRGAKGVSDRGHTAISQMPPEAIDWHHVFGEIGVRWFHTGGIYAALSDEAAATAETAMRIASSYGTVVSYDLNFRPSLWEAYGGSERAQQVNRSLAKHVDVMLGNEEDFSACLGYVVPDTAADFTDIETDNFKKMISEVVVGYPNFKVVATTLRGVIDASRNDWGAIAWAGGKFFEAPDRKGLPILDRVGGGDSFASGLIYGLLTYGDPQLAVEYGAAHGALAMTTAGDTSMATLSEVEAAVGGGSARVQR